MLRGSTIAEKRNLELKVVPLPVGADPAELIQRDGAGAIEAAVGRAVPFVRFRVERVLEAGDDQSPEGRDAILAQLRPVFKTLPPSAMRMELTRMVSSRLALPESLAEQLLAGTAEIARPSNGGGHAPRRGQAADPERAFLALCIAAPEAGAVALAGLDVDEDFSSDLLRRAARHLGAGSLAEPMSQQPGETLDLDSDAELKGLLAELIVEAGREEPKPAMIEVQRLQLELARTERGIQRSRGHEGSDVMALAQRRAELKVQFDRAYSRVLEDTGDPGTRSRS
jgi:DNA primase